MKKSHKVGNEELFEEFCFDRGIRLATINDYKDALQKYSNFINKTLEELIDEAEKEEKSDIRLRSRKI